VGQPENLLENQLLDQLSPAPNFGFDADWVLIPRQAAAGAAGRSIRKDADACTMRPVERCQDPAGKSTRDQGAHDPGDRSPTDSGSLGWVLLVDDDASVRETLADLLEVGGFSIVQAVDAASALEILRRGSAIDVLVTDLSMPGDDGIALIREARRIRSGLPAILLTGYAEQAAATATIAGGHFRVLRKPVESDHLIEQVARVMAQPNT